MTKSELPKRLYKGDVVQEDCLAVPISGPGNDGYVLWRDIEDELEQADFPESAEQIGYLCMAAEAPRPLRRGDRVKVKVTATINQISDDGHCRVFWDDQAIGNSYVLPVDAVTFIKEGEYD